MAKTRSLSLLLFLAMFSDAQNLNLETHSNDNKCSIKINGEEIYSRECEYELGANLIFQDIQNYAACSGRGPLRIFEKRDDDVVKFKGEVDWCASVPYFDVSDEAIVIIDKPHKSALTNTGEPNFKSSGKLSDERKYKFKNGKIKKI